MGSSTQRQQSKSRLILTQIGSYRVAFPTGLVGEIVSFERSQLLSLPMYVHQCLGIVHHRGTLMPLYSLRADPAVREPLSGTLLTAIRLGDEAGERAGIGIEIDRLLGQVSLQQEDKRMLAVETGIGTASSAEQRFKASSPIGDRFDTETDIAGASTVEAADTGTKNYGGSFGYRLSRSPHFQAAYVRQSYFCLIKVQSRGQSHR